MNLLLIIKVAYYYAGLTCVWCSITCYAIWLAFQGVGINLPIPILAPIFSSMSGADVFLFLMIMVVFVHSLVVEHEVRNKQDKTP